MIKDPPLLTIRRNFPRPSAAEVKAFAGAQTGHVIDAMNGRGSLDYRIKPLAPPASTVVGVAMTCHCGPADNLALFGALAVAQPGDILVAGTDEFTTTSVTGDLLMGMARNRGLLGLITDGVARDRAGILGVGLPVYCMGLNPNSPVRSGPGTVGQPVALGGVIVDSGDIIVADADGVVIVPRAKAQEVIKTLALVREAEVSLEAKVKAGLQVPDFVTAILASDKVLEIT
jgi:4-hydroxy-4-methyl-2-oxoglutarate aldolase